MIRRARAGGLERSARGVPHPARKILHARGGRRPRFEHAGGVGQSEERVSAPRAAGADDAAPTPHLHCALHGTTGVSPRARAVMRFRLGGGLRTGGRPHRARPPPHPCGARAMRRLSPRAGRSMRELGAPLAACRGGCGGSCAGFEVELQGCTCKEKNLSLCACRDAVAPQAARTG